MLQILEGPPPSARDAGGAVTGAGPDHGSRAGRDRHSHAGFPDARRRKDDRALDKDEEDYFNEDRYLNELKCFALMWGTVYRSRVFTRILDV